MPDALSTGWASTWGYMCNLSGGLEPPSSRSAPCVCSIGALGVPWSFFAGSGHPWLSQPISETRAVAQRPPLEPRLRWHSSRLPLVLVPSQQMLLFTFGSENLICFLFLILQKQAMLVADYIEMDWKDQCSHFLVPSRPSPTGLLQLYPHRIRSPHTPSSPNEPEFLLS